MDMLLLAVFGAIDGGTWHGAGYWANEAAVCPRAFRPVL